MPGPAGAEVDVVIVGARCAGSSLAVRLRRAGLSVLVLDQARFPSEVPSTHVVQPAAVRQLVELGVWPDLVRAGAGLFRHTVFQLDGLRREAVVPLRAGEPGMSSIRRAVLDATLVDAARAAGATVLEGVPVSGLLTDPGGRVTGVRAGGQDVRASLVVGADGRRSVVARSAGARAYHVVQGERCSYWGYFRGVAQTVPTSYVVRRGGDAVLACPADNDLYEVIVVPDAHDRDAFRRDATAAFLGVVASVDGLGDDVRPASLAGPLRSFGAMRNYFREAAGPGWVLVGDAGISKDPTTGQGISDALRQGEQVAELIGAHLGDPAALDRALRRWWRQRDRESFEHYWFSHDLGRRGTMPDVVVRLLSLLSETEFRQFVGLLDQKTRPRDVFTPARLARALSTPVAGSRVRVRSAAPEVAALAADQLSRNYRRMRPVRS